MLPPIFDPNPYPILRIWGGEGERDTGDQPPPADAPPDGDTPDQQDAPDGDAGDDNSKPDGVTDPSEKADPKLSLEEQLDAERRKNLKLQRDLNKTKADKDKVDADKDAAKERDQYKNKYTKAEKLLSKNLLVWSIASNDKYQWENPEDVIAFIKADEINIDLDSDEPCVEGIELALKRIAKDKPYLLKKKKQEKEDDEIDGQPSGSKAGGGKVESAEAEAKRLGEKFKIPGYGMQAVRPV